MSPPESRATRHRQPRTYQANPPNILNSVVIRWFRRLLGRFLAELRRLGELDAEEHIVLAKTDAEEHILLAMTIVILRKIADSWPPHA